MFALTLTACVSGPNDVRPEVTTPQAYKENVGWKTAEPRDQLSRGDWWTIFHDAELDALQNKVLVANQNLRAAEARYRQARALTQSARAALFPTVSANVSATRGQSAQSAASANRSNTATTNAIATQRALSFEANWEADVWGRIGRSVEAASANADASAADLASATLSIQAELALDYFSLRVLDVQLKLYDETIAAYEKSLALTRNRYATGVAARVDIVQAQTQLKSTQAQAIDLRNQRAQLEHAIALLVGQTPADFSLTNAPLIAATPALPAGLPSQLLERRPDIAAAERRVVAANAQIGVAQAAFFPALSLSAASGYQSASMAHWLTAPNLFWSLGPNLAQTIFNGGLLRARSEQARAAYDESVANYRQTVLAGFQEVEDNLAALRYLEQAADAQQEAAQLAQEAVDLTMNQYRAGLVSYLNVASAQTTALSNERSRVDILGRRLAASVQLIRALGGTWRVADLADQPRADIDRQAENRGMKEERQN
jgi:NodT family efflux transporter outer membrane factor (OMF) lipoprotein